MVHVREPSPVVEESKDDVSAAEHIIPDSEGESEDELEDASDPFEVHFADPDENILTKRLEALQVNQWSTQKTILPNGEAAILSIPGTNGMNGEQNFNKVRTPSDLKLHKKLVSIIEEQHPEFDELESTVAPLMFGYQDLLFYERKVSNAESLRRLACLHAVNHVFK